MRKLSDNEKQIKGGFGQILVNVGNVLDNAINIFDYGEASKRNPANITMTFDVNLVIPTPSSVNALSNARQAYKINNYDPSINRAKSF